MTRRGKNTVKGANMSSPAFIHLYGSLRKNTASSAAGPMETDLETPLPLMDLIQKLGISPDLIQLAMVNHKPVRPDSKVSPGDRVALFPLEYPFFADWRGHRF